MQLRLNNVLVIKKILFALFLVAIGPAAIGQNNDLQMAEYYFQEGEYEKAKLYYEKLYSPSSSTDFYEQYVATLLELKEYDEAEKITKKKIKQEDFGAFFKVKLGTIYEHQGQQEKANSYYQKLIEDLDRKNNTNEYSLFANEFIKLQKYEEAIAILKKCDKTHDNSNNRISIANLHGMMGKYELMFDEYLDQLALVPRDIALIKIILPRSINFVDDKEEVDMLKKKTLKKIQKNPENESLYDLLIWIFQQSDDFESALIQVKALDKRTKKKGERIFEFGQLCLSNKKYDLAIESFEYCIANYPSSEFSNIASKQAVLKTLQLKIFSNATYSQNDLQNLKKRYISTLAEIESNKAEFELKMGLAYLEGFYLHNKDTAQLLYNQLLEYPGISEKDKGMVKMELADILMLKNKIWDASLLYMQVEKKFKHDIVGSQAKFKNAKLYYYTGDFEWSQNQLDGLKASTSKLISNDAIDLSLLITDNYNMDTTPINMKQFAKADLYIFQNELELATQLFDSILMRNPNHSLADEIIFKKYEIAFKKQDFEKAATLLGTIIADYKEGILADNSLFRLAELQENQLNEPKKAMELYEKLLFEYPGSLFVVEARKRYRAYKEKYPTTSDEIKTITQ